MDTPAEVFPIGDFLSDELIARGEGLLWLSMQCPDIPENRLVELLFAYGTAAPLAAHEADQLAIAFGTDPELLLNIDRQYHTFHRATDAVREEKK
jgi:plasmid maintenance system antidote protein VapI